MSILDEIAAPMSQSTPAVLPAAMQPTTKNPPDSFGSSFSALNFISKPISSVVSAIPKAPITAPITPVAPLPSPSLGKSLADLSDGSTISQKGYIPPKPALSDGSTISQAPASNDPWYMKAAKAASDSFTGTITDTANAMGDLINSLVFHDQLRSRGDTGGEAKPQPSVAEQVTNSINAGLGIVNTIFAMSGIPEAFAAGEQVPVVAPIFKGIDTAFKDVAEVYKPSADAVVNSLPISDDSKKTLMPAIESLFGTLAQLAVGKTAHDTALPKIAQAVEDIKSTVSAAIEAATRDKTVVTTPAGTIHIPADTIRDYIAGRAITDQDATDLYKTLGRTPDQIRQDVRNGVSIEIPEKTMTILQDKPYWAAIKDLFAGRINGKPIPNAQGGFVKNIFTAGEDEDVSPTDSDIDSNIPKDLQSLAEEAKKYGSAKDFVAKANNSNLNGIVPEWGTRNQYNVENPFKENGGIGEKGNQWELEQVTKDKPAYLNGSINGTGSGIGLKTAALKQFAADNGLVYKVGNGREVVAKDIASADKVINAKDQRSLGLALGYQDLGGPINNKTLIDIYNKAADKKASNSQSSMESTESLSSKARQIRMSEGPNAELPNLKVPQTASDIVGNGSNLHEIEANTQRYVDANKEDLVSDYKAKFGNIFNVDNMKSLIPGHDDNPTISEAFHRPAAQLMGKMIDKAISDNTGTGKNVVFLAGSPAAGKSTAIESLANHDEYLAHAGVVVDGTLADGNRSSDLIGKALKEGQPVQIFYVENTPDRITDNLISRAQSGGRTVPIETTFNAFQKSRQNIHRFAAKFVDAGKNFNVTVIDNSGDVPRIVDNGVGFIRNKVYSADDIQRAKDAAYTKVNTLYDEGQISKKIRDGFIRRKAPTNAAQEVRPENGRFHGEESDKGISEEEKPKPEKTTATSVLDQRVDEVKTQLSIIKESLSNHPAKGLLKYANFKTGELAEVLGGKGGKFQVRGDEISHDLGFKDSEEARRSYEDYLKQRTKAVVLEQEYKGLKNLQQDQIRYQKALKAADDFIEKSSGEMDKGLEAAARARLRERLQSMRLKAEATKKSAHAGLRRLEQTLSQEAPALDRETLSLEAQALQASNIDYSELPSVPKIVINLATSVKDKVGILDYIRTPDRVLRKIGLEKNARQIRTSYENYLSELPQHIELLQEWVDRALKYPGSDLKIFNYLDGKLTKTWDAASKKMAYNMTKEEFVVASEIKAYLKDWAYRLGLPDDNQITNYITHIFEKGAIPKEFDEDLAKIIQNKVPGSVYNPFLEKRMEAPNYIQSARRALEAYIKRAVRKVNMDNALENLKEDSKNLEISQFNYVKQYADRVNLRPTTIDNLADNTIKQIIGYRFGQRPVANITGNLRKWVSRGKLGLNFTTAVKTLTQATNTYAYLGEKYTALGYMKLLNGMYSKELTDNNVLSQNVAQDRTMSAGMKAIQKMDKVLYSFFDTAIRINNGAAYFGAKAKGINQGMTEQAAIQYAKDMVAKTQFHFGQIDTPVALQSDLAKTFFQFGSFTLKQSEFLAEMFQDKKWSGLLRYAIASFAIVYALNKILDISYSDFLPNPFSLFGKFGSPPILGFPIAVINALTNQPDKFGHPYTNTQKTENVASSLIPYIPAGVQAQRTIQGAEAISANPGSNPATVFKTATAGKYGMPKPIKQPTPGDAILKKYGIGKQQKSQAASILSKYGIK